MRLWVWHAIAGDPVALALLIPGVNQGDAQLREQAVRILGRDCRENGRVAYQQPGAQLQPAASRHLDALLAMADDPDAGVRRELILALRNLPTDKVGDALRKLAASWDGQDRWYLEALGLALDKRESNYLAGLFDGTLYGDLGLDRAGKQGRGALPPYFPVDRNEAYIETGTPDLPASAISKYLGLAWRVHRPEALPLLERVIPYLRAPELQQAADDILERMNEPETAGVVASMAMKTNDPVHQRELLALLARRMTGSWNAAHDQPKVLQVIQGALTNPETRQQGIALAAATGDGRYRGTLEGYAEDVKAPEEVRVAAVEAIGSFNITPNRVLEQLVSSVRGKPSSNSVAEAAVRAMARHSGARGRLTDLVIEREYPLGLRREALRSLAQLRDGGTHVIELARTGKLPEDLKSEAATFLYTSADRRLREAAESVLPRPTAAAGRPLPSMFELIRRDGQPDKGRAVFFRAGTNSCGSCHRVQGNGQWVGPDLSTIGVKYGKEELIRSILSPSAAIGYSFRSLVLALSDGRVVTGLPIEETADRLVLKTAEGQRVVVPVSSIEERRTSDVSLMPEGLAQTMTDQELVDLLAYLTTLKQPVSIVGQYQAIGPIHEPDRRAIFNPIVRLDRHGPFKDERGRELSWRRMTANAEGQVDLAPLVAGDNKNAAYVWVPVVSPVAQKARLVFDTPVDITVWLDGKPTGPFANGQTRAEPRTMVVDLPEGSSTLLIRVPESGRSTAPATLVTTVVADRPVGFNATESGTPASGTK